MGYNTTVFILNDCLPDITRNPEKFVDDIWSSVHDGNDHALGQTTIIRSDHADTFRLYGTHQNSIVELSKWSRRTEGICTNEYGLEMVRGMIEKAKKELADLEESLDKHYGIE